MVYKSDLAGRTSGHILNNGHNAMSHPLFRVYCICDYKPASPRETI